MISISTIADITLAEVIKRSPFPDSEAILRECIYRSTDVRYGFVDGKLACMWGLIPPTLLSETAYLWLLTTDIITEHKFLFIRHSQRYIEEALKIYPTIIGDTEVTNAPARKWLTWLGAEFNGTFQDRITFTIKKRALH